MKYVIDEDVCKEHKLTLSEVFMLLLLRTGITPEETVETLCQKRLLNKKETLLGNEYSIPIEKIKILKDILERSSAKNVNIDEKRIEKLVLQMMDIFPPGIQQIVNNKKYYWRCNKRENMNSLRRFFLKYGPDTYTDEQILEATKKYVDPKPFRTLKYFIIKSVVENGEDKNYVREISDLADMLDNPESTSFEDSDWQTSMR